MNTLSLALVSVGFSVAAQFAMKTGMKAIHASEGGLLATATNPWVLLGFSLYGFGAVVWLRVLADWDVSKAYPMVGIGFVATVAIGALAGEQLTWGRLVGAILISIGVALVGRS